MIPRLLPALLLISLSTLALAQDAPILVPEWQVVGPFETGSREGLVHPLADVSGRVPRTFPEGQSWPSVLADGGRAGWKRVLAERDADGKLTGKTTLKLEGVAWEAREDEWGAAAVANVAFARASFELPAARLLLLEASRCSVDVNGTSFAGDPYGNGIARSVVRGLAGANALMVATSGYGGERAFELKLTPLSANDLAQIVAADVLVPDLVEDEAGMGFAGVPVVNTTDAWLDGLELDLSGGVAGTTRVPWPIAPLGAAKIPMQVTWPATKRPEGDSKEVPVTVTLRRVGGATLATASAKAPVRKADEVRATTFLSRIDGSAQRYAVFPDANRDGGTKALILSLHGAAVDCVGQARSYAPKDWARVVAPQNRRPFGFDWQDWGALDAEEALADAMRRFPTDPDRVHASGHSMGGHGVWVFGITHPGLFASLAPSAGWSGYDTYVPMTLRRSVNFAPAELSAIYFRAIATGRASTLLENVARLPVHVLHGSIDDNVPAPQGRLLAGALERLGGDVVYEEVAGKNHWWDIDKARPGADCLDEVAIEELWKRSVRDRWPRRVVLATSDLDVCDRSAWVGIERQERTADVSRVEAEVEGAATASPRVVARTRNVARFALHLSPELVASSSFLVSVDGEELSVRLAADRRVALFARTSRGTWTATLASDLPAPRSPDSSPGSFKKAMYRPFALVVGTAGPASRNERMMELARSFALAWWVRANGTCRVLRDVDVTPELRSSTNLVLLGGPEINAETRRIERDLVVVATTSGVTLAGRRVSGDDLACAHWQPAPHAPGRRVLVYQATTPDGDALLGALNPVGSGQGWPDFVVATPAIRLRSWGGFAAAGFWDPDFRFDPANAWTENALQPLRK